MPIRRTAAPDCSRHLLLAHGVSLTIALGHSALEMLQKNWTYRRGIADASQPVASCSQFHLLRHFLFIRVYYKLHSICAKSIQSTEPN